jgi:hypothetical protein
MGTRSLTFVYDEDKQPLFCLYRQYDGYPSGHGSELAEFLSKFTIINGIGSNQSEFGRFANGMGCLAAQIVSNFKTEVGGFYLYPTNTKDAGQDYEYHVYRDFVEVKNPDNVIFRGDYLTFLEYCSQEEFV